MGIDDRTPKPRLGEILFVISGSPNAEPTGFHGLPNLAVGDLGKKEKRKKELDIRDLNPS
jgi:hypothetical protein